MNNICPLLEEGGVLRRALDFVKYGRITEWAKNVSHYVYDHCEPREPLMTCVWRAAWLAARAHAFPLTPECSTAPQDERGHQSTAGSLQEEEKEDQEEEH